MKSINRIRQNGSAQAAARQAAKHTNGKISEAGKPFIHLIAFKETPRTDLAHGNGDLDDTSEGAELSREDWQLLKRAAKARGETFSDWLVRTLVAEVAAARQGKSKQGRAGEPIIPQTAGTAAEPVFALFGTHSGGRDIGRADITPEHWTIILRDIAARGMTPSQWLEETIGCAINAARDFLEGDWQVKGGAR